MEDQNNQEENNNNKDLFSDTQNSEQPNDVNSDIPATENKEALKETFKSFIKSLTHLITSTLNFSDEVDQETCIKEIKAGIEFKGFNVWILIFSIAIASIGLNVNSIAVIIGAMLISPLMGPIMGIGLSVGINDWETLMKSLKNLSITVVVSIVTSTIYFLISPFGEAGPEILNRTRPELLDVFVAIFGGFAGIMASTRNKVTNVVPGVAIATALMPPLCVTGYGLANLEWSIFRGAFYLFLINGVYISLTTFIVVKYLKFPLKHLLDEQKEKKLKKYILIFAVLLIIPSVYTLYNTYQETRFKTAANSYVDKYFVKHEVRSLDINFNDGEPIIEVSLFGKQPYSTSDLENWKNEFGLESANLVVREDTRLDTVLAKIEEGKYKGSQYFEEIYPVHRQQINQLHLEVDSLKNQINNIQADTIPFQQLKKEVLVHFDKVGKFEYSVSQITDFDKDYSIPSFYIKWKPNTNRRRAEKKMYEWLKVRLELDTLRVLSY